MQTFANGFGMFQHFLAPFHNLKKGIFFTKIKKLDVLDWPGNSPDVKPMKICGVF